MARRSAAAVALELAAEQARRNAAENLAAYTEFMEYPAPALHHKHLISKLHDVESLKITRLMVMMPPGSAKALALDTPVPTPSGWTVMGSLREGDWVFGETGHPCRVTRVSPIWQNRTVYRVETDCGDAIIADETHEWRVRLCGKPGRTKKRKPFKIKETRELCRRRAKRPMIERAAALQLPDADLPIHPYVLGAWLGDGNSRRGEMCAGDQDRWWFRQEIERLGYETTVRQVRNNFTIRKLRKPLVEMGLLYDPSCGVYGSKSIPVQYLRGSVQQRLALLQGLVDTDGTVCKTRGCVTFTNTNRALAEGVQELVRSLGRKASMNETRATLYGRDCGPVYRLSFYHAEAARLPRKRDLCRDQYRTPNTYIDVTLEKEARDTVCITVDSPSHLFLCGRSMTPTHNSFYGSILFPSWYMGRHPKHNIIAASHTAVLAERFGRRVRNLVMSDEYQEVFPEVRVASDSQASARWTTKAGGEYLAVGAGSALPGYRGDCGIIDDPVAGREQADSELEREKIYQWYLNDFWPRLKPAATAILIMQRWHEDDLAGRILADMKDGGEQWEVVKFKMEADENDPLGRKPGEPLWPEWYTDAMRTQAKRDPRSWSALYQQEPRPDSGGVFKRHWLRYYRARPQKDMNVIILVDPAGEKKKDSDYTAMWLLGLAHDQNVYALDIVRARLSLTERAEQIFKWHREWTAKRMKPRVVAYEKYSMQSDIEHLRHRMEEENYRFHVTEAKGNVRKQDRIKRLIPWFEGGRIWLPETLHKANDAGVPTNLIDEFIEQEYASFPVSKWFDMLDALSRIEDLSHMGLLRFPSPTIAVASDFQGEVRFGSWMCV